MLLSKRNLRFFIVFVVTLSFAFGVTAANAFALDHAAYLKNDYTSSSKTATILSVINETEVFWYTEKHVYDGIIDFPVKDETRAPGLPVDTEMREKAGYVFNRIEITSGVDTVVTDQTDGTVKGIMPEKNLSITYYYILQEYNFTAKIFYNDVEDDGLMYTNKVKFKTNLNYNPEAVAARDGYTLKNVKLEGATDLNPQVKNGSVTGTMPTSDVTVYYYYSNQYDYIEKHVYDGVEDIGQRIESGIAFSGSIDSSAKGKEGYLLSDVKVVKSPLESDLIVDASSGTVKGTMPKGTVEIVYSYSIASYSLNERYIYSGEERFNKGKIVQYGNDIATTWVERQEGYTFSYMEIEFESDDVDKSVIIVDSDGGTISGTMPGANVNIVYYYSNDYTFTETHVYDDISESFSSYQGYKVAVSSSPILKDGYEYSSVRIKGLPQIPGVNIDVSTGIVSGDMPAGSFEVIYTYKRVSYSLNVKHDFGEGIVEEETNPTLFKGSVNENEKNKSGYSLIDIVVEPADAAIADIENGTVIGSMPAQDVTITFTYEAVDTPYEINYYFFNPQTPDIDPELNNEISEEISEISGIKLGKADSLLEINDYKQYIMGYEFEKVTVNRGSDETLYTEDTITVNGSGYTVLNLYYAYDEIEYRIGHHYPDGKNDKYFPEFEEWAKQQYGYINIVPENAIVGDSQEYVITRIVINDNHEILKTQEITSMISGSYIPPKELGKQIKIDLYYAIPLVPGSIEHKYWDRNNNLDNPRAPYIEDLFNSDGTSKSIIEFISERNSYKFREMVIVATVTEQTENNIKGMEDEIRASVETALNEKGLENAVTELKKNRDIALASAENIRAGELDEAQKIRDDLVSNLERAIAEATAEEKQALEDARIMSEPMVTAIQAIIDAENLNAFLKNDEVFMFIDGNGQTVLNIDILIGAIEKNQKMKLGIEGRFFHEDEVYLEGNSADKMRSILQDAIADNEQKAESSENIIRAAFDLYEDIAYDEDLSVEDNGYILISSVSSFIDEFSRRDEAIKEYEASILELEKQIEELDPVEEQEEINRILEEINGLNEKIEEEKNHEGYDEEGVVIAQETKGNVEKAVEENIPARISFISLQGIATLFEEENDIDKLLLALSAFNDKNFAEQSMRENEIQLAEKQFNELAEDILKERDAASGKAWNDYHDGLLSLALENSVDEALIEDLSNITEYASSIKNETITIEDKNSDYVFKEGVAYEIVINYEYIPRRSSTSDGGSGNNVVETPETEIPLTETPGNEDPDADGSNLNDNEIPMTQLEISDSPVPLEALPKTSGVAPGFLYGFGILLTFGGMFMRRKSDK